MQQCCNIHALVHCQTVLRYFLSRVLSDILCFEGNTKGADCVAPLQPRLVRHAWVSEKHLLRWHRYACRPWPRCTPCTLQGGAMQRWTSCTINYQIMVFITDGWFVSTVRCSILHPTQRSIPYKSIHPSTFYILGFVEVHPILFCTISSVYPPGATSIWEGKTGKTLESWEMYNHFAT